METINIQEVWGTDELKNAFMDDLSWAMHELPLEHFCEQGGWPNDDTCKSRLIEFRNDANSIFATIRAEFDEMIPTDCEDISRENPVFGELKIIVDRVSGDIEVDDA